ncbi:MAG: glycosyltransferase [Gemmatimonadetes bacterium]|nr:glycosyltransferase [Gemmatimonadota bacterium]
MRPPRLRVLFVTHNIPRHPGDAAGSFVLRLGVALQASGQQVHVIAPGGDGLADREVLEGVSIERVRYAPPGRMTLAHSGTMAEAVRGSWGGCAALVGLLRALRKATKGHLVAAAAAGEHVDVLHAHWWFPSGLALWGLPRRAGVPLVITMHGSDVRLAQGVRPVHPLMRSVLRQAAARTTVSAWLKDAVRSIAPDLPVSVAPMPVDVNGFPPGDPGHPRSGILFVGRLNVQKGPADLLEALARKPLAQATLSLAGEGPEEGRLKARAEALGLGDRIRWLGMLPPQALADCYRRAAVVAMPSRGEGLGLVAVEAQLSGTPVVAYADGGLPDVVRPADGGVLVPPGDIDALADALGHVLESPEEGRRRGGVARAAMVERFAPSAVAERYLDTYRAARDRAP